MQYEYYKFHKKLNRKIVFFLFFAFIARINKKASL